MIRKHIPLVAILVATATIATAQARPWGGPPGGPGGPGGHAALMGELFPPELVMRHQQEIGLSDDQKSKLVQAMQDMQTDLVPLQFEMGDATARLREALAQPRIDEQKAGDLADRLMSLETRIKRRHLTTMIRMKNVLTPDQQDRLRALREQEPPRHGRRGDRSGPPDGGPGAPPDGGDGLDPESGN